MADGRNERVNDFHPEFLRPVEHVCEPDPRNTVYVILDPENGERPLDIRDQHASIRRFNLNKGVPEDVVFQFETAKNLYLYAWFVFRFYPVAEHQALACLELALRKQFEKALMKERLERSKKHEPSKKIQKPSLRPLLRYAISHNHIRHEGFQRWHEAARRRAEHRYQIEKVDEMYKKGLSSIDCDYSEVMITDADRNWKYLDILQEKLPELRNLYAHGTSNLDNQVLGTIEAVSEMINQIYPVE